MIRRSTWIILAVFVLALAGTVLWQRNVKEKEAQATPAADDAGYLFDFGTNTLTGLRIERVSETVMEFQRGADDSWAITWPQGLNVDSPALEGTLSQLAATTTLAKMDQAPALASMGLEPPAYRLLLTLSDGSQRVAAVGHVTPTESGYYVLVGSQGVYVVNKFALDPILGLIDNPPLLIEEAPLATAPAPDAPPPVGTP